MLRRCIERLKVITLSLQRIPCHTKTGIIMAENAGVHGPKITLKDESDNNATKRSRPSEGASAQRSATPTEDYDNATGQDIGGPIFKQDVSSRGPAQSAKAPLRVLYQKAKCANDATDSVWGTIFGNCMGDAIGLLTEFMGKGQADHTYEKALKHGGLEYKHKIDDRHRRRWKKGDWTDDSDQMILIMRSLTEHKGQIIPADYGFKVKHWAYNGFHELGDKGGCGLGATTFQVLEHPQFDKDPHSAAKQTWIKSGYQLAPNGGVMRTSPLGIFQFYQPELVKSNTLAFCRVTHADFRCEASCIAVTTAISLMLRREEQIMNPDRSFNVEKIIQESYDAAVKYFDSLEYADTILTQQHRTELFKYMFSENIGDLFLDEEAKIGYTYKSMGAGFWALRQADFREALTAITMEAGDADTNGAVAGALLGCKLGYSSLDEKIPTWLHKLLHKDWLIVQIDGFLDVVNNDIKANKKEKKYGKIGSCPKKIPTHVEPAKEGMPVHPTQNSGQDFGKTYTVTTGAPDSSHQPGDNKMPSEVDPSQSAKPKDKPKDKKGKKEKKDKEKEKKHKGDKSPASHSDGPPSPSPKGGHGASLDGKHITAPSVNNQEYYHLNEFISGTDNNVTPVPLTPNTQLGQPEYSHDGQQKRRKHSSHGSDASPTPSPVAPITPSYPAISQPSHQSYAPAPQHAYSQGPYYHGQPQAGHQPYSPGGQVYPTVAPQGHTVSPGFQQGYHQQQNHPGQGGYQAYPPTAQHGYTQGGHQPHPQDQNYRSHLQSPHQVNSSNQQGDHFTYPEQHGGHHPQTQQPPRPNPGQYQHPQIQPQHGADGLPAARPKMQQSRSQEDGAFQRGNVSRAPQSSRPIHTVQGHARDLPYNERSVDGPVTPSAGQKSGSTWYETTPKTPTTPNDPNGGKRISKDDSDVKLSSEMSFNRGHKARWSFRVSGRKKKNSKENILASPQVQQAHTEARNESQFDRTTPLRKSKAELKKEKKDNKEREKEQRRQDALARNAADQDNEHSEKKKKSKAACVIS